MFGAKVRRVLRCVVAGLLLGVCAGHAMERSAFRPWRSPLDGTQVVMVEQGIGPEDVDLVLLEDATSDAHAQGAGPVVEEQQQEDRRSRQRRALAAMRVRYNRAWCQACLLCGCGVVVGMAVMGMLCSYALCDECEGGY